MLTAVPLTLAEAQTFVGRHHRHSKPPVGGRFAIGAAQGESLVGVAIVGRPIARMLDDGWTAEVTRCCVVPDAPKGACSWLYARCWRLWQVMGGTRLITYTLQSESGASLRGAGMRKVRETGGRQWSCQSRPRVDTDISTQPKFCWEFTAQQRPDQHDIRGFTDRTEA